MAMPEVSRTLVKSAPELWAELSDPEALGRHLEVFGCVAITDAQAEKRLAWEAERATGTLALEPSGFGTRLTAAAEPRLADPPPAPEPEPAAVEPQPPAEAVEPPPGPAKHGFWARLRRRRPTAPPPAAPPASQVVEAESPPAPAPEPLIDPAAAEAALATMLDALGTARHRPFSRA